MFALFPRVSLVSMVGAILGAQEVHFLNPLEPGRHSHCEQCIIGFLIQYSRQGKKRPNIMAAFQHHHHQLHWTPQNWEGSEELAKKRSWWCFRSNRKLSTSLRQKKNEGIIHKVQSRNEYDYPLGHTSRWNSSQWYHLEQWFSTSLILQLFNTVHHVVVTPTKIVFIATS